MKKNDQFSKKELEQILGGSSTKGILTLTLSEEAAIIDLCGRGYCKRGCSQGCLAGCMSANSSGTPPPY